MAEMLQIPRGRSIVNSGAVLLLLCLLAVPVVAAATRPTPVSPGSLRHVTSVDVVCPTFNWAGVDGALGYDLAVFAAPTAPAGAVTDDPGDIRLRPILQHRIPGAALGWTPPAGRCLQRGGTYGWVVRAVGPEGTGAWSEPHSFRVTNQTSEDEVRSALEVLRGYLGQEGDDTPDSAASGPTGQAGSPPAKLAALSGLDAEHASAAYLVLGPTGTGPPPPDPPPISFFTVDNTGSVFAPKVTANSFVGEGFGLTDVNATRLGGRMRSYFADGTHSHEPIQLCWACSSSTPGCAELCELNQPSADALESRCYGGFFDSGGPSGDYSDAANVLLNLCSPDLGKIYALFSSFQTENGPDVLYIFDGLGNPTNRCGAGVPVPASGQTLLGSFTGSTSPGFQSGDSGCLAFLFCSNGDTTASGWAASLGCY